MNPLLLALCLALAADPNEGVRPLGADGKPLNLDFETGTLDDWTAEGEAFRGQPVKGDAVAARRADMKSGHQGQFWIGGYERGTDKPQGTLTSAPFKVTHPWASFLVGGGASAETHVEVLLQPDNAAIFRASGRDQEDMERVAVDLAKYAGKEIRVRLVDRHSGAWGHVNFDDFRFHAARPAVAERPVKPTAARPDEYKFAGLPPDKAAAAMTVPEGFEVKLFAGEPDVHQPVALCLDDRGRVWVAEAYTYPRRHPFPGPVLPDAQKKDGDRILVFEDTDGDGKFDKSIVVAEGLNLVSGLEVGFGGVWVGAAPYLLFIPLDPKTDKPTGPPEVLLDGWGYQDTHETLNGFIWGPDGWLYGCHGVFTHSKVGKPGATDAERTPLNAGVWRYHPTRRVFEAFAHGTSNPWGLDYNDVGDFFASACVIPHCYHVVQGGRYQRQAGQHFNPYTYVDIQTIADHRHYVGATPHAGNNRSDSAGGGHAHCGLMCYLGGAWPKEYRGKLFMGNLHGRRLNVDELKPKGSGYVAGHNPDFLMANDAWARFINLRYGPDGNVYLIDWYDKQACHLTTPEVWDRTNGRVYKISYRATKPVVGLDLKRCNDAELVKYQLHDNDWYVRHARRILQERAAEIGRDAGRQAAVLAALAEIETKHPDATRRLRALWAYHVLLPDRAFPIGSRTDASEHVRGWGVILDRGTVPGQSPYVAWASLAEDRSPVVRRYVASAWLADNYAGGNFPSLFTHPEDAADPVLPYLQWYLMEAAIAGQPAHYLTAAAGANQPQLFPLAARRVGAAGTPEAFAILAGALTEAGTDDRRRAYLAGLREGLKGKRKAAMPKEWPPAFAALQSSPDGELRLQAQAVAVAFGDAAAADALRATLADAKAEAAPRQAALAALLEARDTELPAVLQSLLADPVLRPAAIRGLAAFDDRKTPAALLAAYPSLSQAERREAVDALAGRPTFARALLEAIEGKVVPVADVPAEVVRQLRNLNDKGINDRLAAVWGTVRDTPADRKKLIDDWSKRLKAPASVPPDLGLGRAVFARTCQQCHTLYGVGGKVGPDITGANRADLAYLLENVFDPSAVIPKEYAATTLALADGRTITGIVKEESKAALTVATATELLVVPAGDVERRTASLLSMMPDDLTKPLSEGEVRALFAYLRHPAQVALAATADTAKDFFNGKDLTGWDADRALWRVENGELVGTSPGLKRNDFVKSQMEVADFRLTVKVRLTPNAGNSGIQFRSEALPNGEMRGPQADIGAGWWGKLYEESARGLLWKESGEKHVKPDDWNEYAVEAKGSRVRTWINGRLCVDLEDAKLSRRGVVAFQLHSGGKFEVRYKEIKLEVLK